MPESPQQPPPRGKRRRAPIDKSVGERIRRSRKAKGLKQKDVAKAAGITPPSLSQIEKGVTFPGTDTLSRIADVVGESVSFLLGGRLVGKRKSYEGLAGRLFDKLGEDRIEYLASLSDEAARALVDQHQLRAFRARRRLKAEARRLRKVEPIR